MKGQTLLRKTWFLRSTVMEKHLFVCGHALCWKTALVAWRTMISTQLVESRPHANVSALWMFLDHLHPDVDWVFHRVQPSIKVAGKVWLMICFLGHNVLHKMRKRIFEMWMFEIVHHSLSVCNAANCSEESEHFKFDDLFSIGPQKWS